MADGVVAQRLGPPAVVRGRGDRAPLGERDRRLVHPEVGTHPCGNVIGAEQPRKEFASHPRPPLSGGTERWASIRSRARARRSSRGCATWVCNVTRPRGITVTRSAPVTLRIA
ncbi:hypothetical protein EF294_00215 [Gordonia oryzae]|uniref:Uncharacterized protein n=1 Tax=Gordonia oryzae TaxID=2487349 RepID=A0A3N4GTE9_9ACTN|nr:hypothetical protein EF294_00215 [Gordonia oryzae]